MQEITIDDAKQNGKVLAVNGILNGDSRAAQLAYQNVPEDQSTGQTDLLTLMHIAPADTGFGELLVAGYEKFSHRLSDIPLLTQPTQMLCRGAAIWKLCRSGIAVARSCRRTPWILWRQWGMSIRDYLCLALVVRWGMKNMQRQQGR